MSFLLKHCSSIARRRFATATSTSTSSAADVAKNGYNFQLSDEQLQMRDVARNFARNEIQPVAAALDRSGEYPLELIRKAWKLGLLNNHVPQAYGGMELNCLTGCMIAEELSYGCAGIQASMKVSDVGVKLI